MWITYDPVKRAQTLADRGFDRVDAYKIQPEEYDELPELTDEMVARSRLMIGDRTIYSYPEQLITLSLPPDVFERWQATGPDWQQRMTELLTAAVGALPEE